MKIALIGCGLIGQKRATLLKPHELVACVDQNFGRAIMLASQQANCKAYQHWQEIIEINDIDIIIIATIHATLSEIAYHFALKGKHIFLEKPAAKHSSELQKLLPIIKQNGNIVRVGFNHRYHRTFQKARQLIDDNTLGELMFIRARYGHGGRIGYEQEWRAQPELSGGGELIDQGVHLIDLARWFLGDFTEVQGYAHTYFWDMPVDDNSFLLLKTANKKIAHLHASCTEWKNTFSFEIYGQQGKIEVSGLGGSYGVERIAFYKMLPQMGPPETYIWEFPMLDNSWELELKEFFIDIETCRQPAPGLHDALAALKIVEEIYRISQYDYST